MTKKKSTAFDRIVEVSDELAAIVGTKRLPRKDVTKKVWEYIKGNSLQDPENRRNICPDAKLATILGTEAINMFKMTALISKHVKTLEPSKEPSKSS